MRNLRSTTVITVASALLATSPPPTNATGRTVQVSSIATTSCVSSGSTRFTMVVKLDGTDNADVLHTQVRSAGLIYENQLKPVSVLARRPSPCPYVTTSPTETSPTAALGPSPRSSPCGSNYVSSALRGL